MGMKWRPRLITNDNVYYEFYEAATNERQSTIKNVKKKTYDEQRFIEAERKSEKTLAIPLFN